MAAEELDGVEVSWNGLAGDRRWAFIRDGQVRSGFPWLTIRERPELTRYRPRGAARHSAGTRRPARGLRLEVEPGRVAVGDPVELEPRAGG